MVGAPLHAGHARERGSGRYLVLYPYKAITLRASVGSAEAARKFLKRWRADPDLAGLRDEKGLAALPERVRVECRVLRHEFAATRKRAGANDSLGIRRRSRRDTAGTMRPLMLSDRRAPGLVDLAATRSDNQGDAGDQRWHDDGSRHNR